MTPPKPPARTDERVPFLRYLRLFRNDILSAQPERLYRAWMAEFRTPFFRSFLINQPEIVRTILKERPGDFPKSQRVTEGLKPLLGDAVFVTNGETWARQRRLIDPAFDHGRLDENVPAMVAAGEAALARLSPGEHEVEAIASHLTADVIFRTLFSIPIEDRVASATFRAFRTYQRAQPILNLGALLPLPRWLPRGHRRATLAAAREIRGLISELVAQRTTEIASGSAPDDLATKIMTARCPVSGDRFRPEEMVDQVAIFFLAGHETSAAALAWALYLLATHPDAQARVADEARILDKTPEAVAGLRFTRDVFREALRLYPPVPMMVRCATGVERFRERVIPVDSQIVLSPWHLHRHARIWQDPDEFDPGRWQTPEGRAAARDAYLPFSSGPRVCPGAAFAMAEGTLLLAMIARTYALFPVQGAAPVPVAHLTVRSRNGIRLGFKSRGNEATL